jgi:Tol biopolymer transport system component
MEGMMAPNPMCRCAIAGALALAGCDSLSTNADPVDPRFEALTNTVISSDAKIAFVRVFGSPATGFDREIFGIREDGTGLIQLTDAPGVNDQPAWSPDGGRLAFRSTRDGDPEIYVMNADGSGILRLTFHPGLDGEPAWSPDGSMIAFRRSEFLGDFVGPGHPSPGVQGAPSQIWIMRADGLHAVRLTDQPQARDAHPTWSPNGSEIAFERTNVNATRVDLLVIGVSGTPQRVLTPWGGDPQALTAGIIRAFDVEPSWSPDGELIAFRAMRDLFGYDVWTVSPGGRELTELLELPGAQITPSWSPDGSRIIFGNQGPGGGLQIINRDGSGLAPLTSGANDFWPTWRR